MLPRPERIGTNEFRRAFEDGRMIRGGLLQLRFYRREKAAHDGTGHDDAGCDNAIEYSKGAVGDKGGQTRAAFVVSRKLAKATVRNSLRRRVREIYRLSAWRHDARLGGTDLLFFASSTALTASNEALHHALDELLERAARSQQGTRPSRAGVLATHRSHRATNTSSIPSSPIFRGKTPDEWIREKPTLDMTPDVGK